MPSIRGRVLSILSDELDVPIEEIADDSDIVENLKADSLDWVTTVLAFEDEFNMRVPDEDYEKLRTPRAIVDYINSKT